MSRDGFIFYASFLTAIEELSDDQQLQVYRAICHYALLGEEPAGNGVTKAMFHLIRPQIDANTKRYENAKKGGRKPAESDPNENQAETDAEPNDIQAKTKLEPRANQTETKPKPNPNQNGTKMEQEETESEPKEKEKEKENDSIPPTPHEGGDAQEKTLQETRFDEFWEAYPKKQGKGAARKAWMRIKPDTNLHNAIMASVIASTHTNPQWLRDNGQYIPNPATWLNQERWTDSWGEAEPTTGGGHNDGSADPGFHRSQGFRRPNPQPDAGDDS